MTPPRAPDLLDLVAAETVSAYGGSTDYEDAEPYDEGAARRARRDAAIATLAVRDRLLPRLYLDSS